MSELKKHFLIGDEHHREPFYRAYEVEAKIAEMQAELDKAREFIKKAFLAHPNLDMDIDFLAKDK